MKLIVAIVNSDDASMVMSELTKNKFSVTKLQTSGGFLRTGNATFLIGVDEEKVEEAIAIIREFSSQRKQIIPVNPTYMDESMVSIPVEVNVGGATVFILDVEQFMKL